MTSYEENILQNLANTTSLEDVSKEQFQELITKYPYYDAPYFFLAKKSYLQKEINHEIAIEKAILHFSNDLWFNYNLNNEEAPQNQVEENAVEIKPGEQALTGENIADDDREVKEDINE